MMSSKRKIPCTPLFMWLFSASCLVGAAEAQQKRPMLEQEIMTSEAFLSSHPDLMNRLRGFHELENRKEPVRAANYFRRAARYADKTSQAMYAEMLWTGNGVKQDKPAAYAWMDLAAERGYKDFLPVRERYWAGLDEAQRKAALDIGRKIYAEYGDEVAKPRMNLIMRRTLRKMTGSRTGSKALAGTLEVRIPGPVGGFASFIKLPGEMFYRDEYWDPKEYWIWKDQNIEGARRGRVTASDIYEANNKPPATGKDDNQ